MSQRALTVPILVLVALASACASAIPLRTPSGQPEIVVSTTDRSLISNVLTETMIEHDFRPVLVNDRLAVFEQPIGGMDALVIGPGLTSDADLRVTCCFLDAEEGGIHMISELEIVSESGTAAERRKPAPRGHDLAHNVQDILNLVKGNVAMKIHELTWPDDEERQSGPEVWTGN